MDTCTPNFPDSKHCKNSSQFHLNQVKIHQILITTKYHISSYLNMKLVVNKKSRIKSIEQSR